MSEILSLIEEDSDSIRRSTIGTGSRGERLAAEYLQSAGYRLVMANFTVPIGRDIRGVQVKGEIDLIALDGEVVCFVEVKTRSSDIFAGPLTAVDVRKQRLITRTARVYRRVFALSNIRYRFDVVTVLDDGRGEPRIELYKAFWTEAKFKKRVWNDELH
jgi:putative endonuclease